MLNARKVDLHLVVSFLLCKMEESRKILSVDRDKLHEAVRVLLVVLRAYYKDYEDFESHNHGEISEVTNEVILEATFQGVLHIAPGGRKLVFLVDHQRNLQASCRGISHNDHWALQNCCAVALAAYTNGVAAEEMFYAI